MLNKFELLQKIIIRCAKHNCEKIQSFEQSTQVDLK